MKKKKKKKSTQCDYSTRSQMFSRIMVLKNFLFITGCLQINLKTNDKD